MIVESTAPDANPEPTGVIRVQFSTVVGEDPNADFSTTERKLPQPPAKSEWPTVRGYEILSVIGVGGMGIVYKARQTELQRTVALKTLRNVGAISLDERLRFHQEAETVAKIQHPNIIQVFEIGTLQPSHGERNTSPFISFEFVDGGSLLKHTESPQPPAWAAQLIEKVARAVNAAHQVGVIHRDLKPGNVLLTRESEPKVADFGLAKHFGGELDSGGRYLTRAGVVMGTPAYMAPEQAAGEDISPSIDIHALGVMLYELLTGRVPFQGTTPIETMYLIRDQEPVSPRQLQPKLPRDLETICLKCLKKYPVERYATAGELADDLARWREGRPIKARPSSAPERAIRWAKRNPAVAALSVAVVMVALAGVSGIVWNWREAEANAEIARRNAINAQDSATKAEEALAIAQASTRSERWLRYRSDIAAASGAIQLLNVTGARDALDDAPVEHRRWEWQHFSSQLDRSQQVLVWPETLNAAYSFSPDGAYVTVLPSHKHGFRTWDLRRSKEAWTDPTYQAFVRTGSYHAKPLIEKGAGTLLVRDRLSSGVKTTIRIPKDGDVFGVETSRDGKRIVTAGEDRTFRVWDEKGAQLRVLPVEDARTIAASMSEDGRYFAVAFQQQQKQLQIWNLETGNSVVTKLLNEDILGGAFTPDCTRLLSSTKFPSNALLVWDTSTGKLLAEMRGHGNQITGTAFNRDCSRAVSSSMDQTARVWDMTTGKLLLKLEGHRDWVNFARYTPDEKRIVTASQDATLRLWDAETGANVAVLPGHTGPVIGMSFTPDGVLASVGADGTIRLWDLAAVERNGVLRGHTNFVYGIAVHPDGERVASVSWDGTIKLWEATSGRQLWSRKLAESYGISVRFHPDGKSLAASSRGAHDAGHVQILATDTGDELHRWSLQLNWNDPRLAFNRTGDMLANGSPEGVVRIWNPQTKAETLTLKADDLAVVDVAFSPDNRWLATAHLDGPGSVRVWDLNTKTPRVLKGHTDYGICVAFSADGKLLATSGTDNTVRLWDTATWEQVGVLKHGAKTYALAFTLDGTRLACGCADSTIRFWDLANQHELTKLTGHTSYVHSLQFSPDGSRLFSGSGDFTVRVWDTRKR